jgi:CubicO group peptidase (beta-lactamase class C family)
MADTIRVGILGAGTGHATAFSQLPGVEVAALWSPTRARADALAGKPMRPDAILRIFSMTKPITSVALMMLFEEGRLLLGEPVSKYIPAFNDFKVYAGTTEAGVECVEPDRPITILDLLTHTAGLA